jgi:uncharacterized lipoprotein YbaY
MKKFVFASILAASLFAGCTSKKSAQTTPAPAATATEKSEAAPSEAAPGGAADAAAPTSTTKADPDDGGEVSPK